MSTAHYEAPQAATLDRQWECPECGEIYPSIWLARECHDPAFEHLWR